MSNLLQNLNDPRTGHGSQALIRSSLGMSKETGQTGYDARFEAGVQYVAPITLDMDTEAVQQYDLPPKTYVASYLVATPAGGAGGLVLIEIIDSDGSVAATALAAGAVDAETVWTALTVPVKPAESGGQSIRFTPDNEATATGMAVLMLQMLPIITAWK
jgi:hypothetical protein